MRLNYNNEAGISEENRRLLKALNRSSKQPFSAQEAAEWLKVDLSRARRFLAYLASREWLARVRPGAYITVPLDAADPSEWREDPWIVAASLFSPCYIAGWSACEHWGLTEQIFRDVAVISSRRIRNRAARIQGTLFRVKVLPPEKLFGLRSVWRREVKIQISDPSRTIVDILDDPSMGGGIRHAADALSVYFKEKEFRNDGLLLNYTSKLNNGAIYKRLGYLVETLRISADRIIGNCRENLTSGISALDPSVKAKGRIIRRWNLRVNAKVAQPEDQT
jgi:predicted transcriptional regulator of viral defense system